MSNTWFLNLTQFAAPDLGWGDEGLEWGWDRVHGGGWDGVDGMGLMEWDGMDGMGWMGWGWWRWDGAIIVENSFFFVNRLEHGLVKVI